MNKWISIKNSLPKNNSYIEVKVGNSVKSIFYTAGMKGEDLHFHHWRYVDISVVLKVRPSWQPNYE